MIRFAGVLRRYSVPCTLIRIETKWVIGEAVKKETRTPMKAPILPLDAKLLQTDGGRYTEDDRAIYSLSPLVKGDIIEYKNCRYTIDHKVDYSEYADFGKYIAKRVSTHG